MTRPVLASLLCLSSSIAWSCSCFGPQNFCASMDTAVTEPDIVVLATKLSDIHYGMQLGSGTWDLLPSVTYSGDHRRWSWGR